MSASLRLVPNVEIVGDRRAAGPQRPVIEEPDGPDMGKVTVEVASDGAVNIDIGGTGIGINQRKPRSTGFDANLAEDLDDMGLAALAAHLIESVDADKASRADWEETVNRAAKYLGIQLNDPSQSISPDGTVCQAVSTVLLEALTKLWGTSRSELLPVGGPVKVRRDNVPPPTPAAAAQPEGEAPAGPGITGAQGPAGPGIGDNGGPPMEQDDLAAALETDLNHYLTVKDKEYYPDTSKMLFSRNLIGMAFKKVYRCPLKRRPISRWVLAQNLIVSNDCAHLSGAGRVTEIIKMRQSIMRRMQVAGEYRDIPLVQPTGQTTETEEAIGDIEGVDPTPTLPGDYEHTVYEVRCELGSGTAGPIMEGLRILDEDETGREPGFPLPYRVSIDLDSREIIGIRRNWKQGDEDYQPRQTYVKYGFVPGLGFYDLGLIHLVGNPTQAATMIERATVDATLFANFPGGLMLQGPTSGQKNTVFRPSPGEFLPVTGFAGQKITDVIMAMPYKEPSAQQMALLQKFEADVRKLTGVIEIPVGEGVGQVPVGTMMSYIEAITQVPGAVHKDDHISQQEEFELLRELLAEEPEVLTRGVRRPARQAWLAAELLDPDLVPAADPNTPSMIHRLMKVQGMVALGGLPQFQGIANNRAIYQKAIRVLADDHPEEYEQPEAPTAAPPPDPRVLAAQIKAQTETTKQQTDMQKATLDHQAKLQEIAATGAQKEGDRQSAEVRAAMAVDAAKVKAQADLAKTAIGQAHDHLQGVQDRTHEAQQGAAERVHDTTNAALDRQQADDHHQAEQQTAQFAAAFAPAPKPSGST